MLRPTHILETVIYASDIPAMVAFYRDALGLDLVRDWSEVGAVLRVNPDSVLLIFDPAKSAVPGRTLPSHGATGPGHLALRISDADYDQWLARLGEHGIAIEHEHTWKAEDGWSSPGRSIYVRDPASNAVELVTTDIWPASPERATGTN